MLKKLIHTTSLRANIIANFVGSGWTAAINLVFIPVYLHYIGPEGYGLIGIFASLQVVLSLLDNGLSTTLNKELAASSVQPGKEQKMRNIVHTLGNVYWLVAAAAGCFAMILSPFLAKYWVQPQALSVSTITYSFLLLSCSLIFQFPIGFYSGGLLGLQRQVMLNILKIFFATLKSAGVLLVLMFISNTVLAFFTWTLLISLLQALTYRYFLHYYLPKIPGKAIFDKSELKKIWQFAAGMTAIGVTSVLLTQADKIILSRILTLEKFGFYTFAFTAGSVSYMIVFAISQSYFPRFSVLLAKGETEELKKVYHQGCKLVTLLVVPFATLLTLFSKEILFLWTQNASLVSHTWQLTSLVSVAVALHCLMFIPYMLTLAYGNTRLALYTNIVILLFLIPGIILSAMHFGGLGGAACWLCINIIYFAVNPGMIHRYYLKGQTAKWYMDDTIKPVVLGVSLLVVARFLLKDASMNNFSWLVSLAILGFTAFSLTLLSSKSFSEPILMRIKTQLAKRRINEE